MRFSFCAAEWMTLKGGKLCPWLIPDVSHSKHDLEQHGKAGPSAAAHPPQHESQLPRHVLRVLAKKALDVGKAATLKKRK